MGGTTVLNGVSLRGVYQRVDQRQPGALRAPKEKLFMRYITPDRGRRRGRALALGAIAAFAATAAPVHAQAPGSAKVTSTETAGMRYIGGDADNNVRFTLSGSTFTVDDRVPIEAGAGCTPVPGDATKVTCVAFKAGTKFKEFNVLTGNGNDTVVNRTSG